MAGADPKKSEQKVQQLLPAKSSAFTPAERVRSYRCWNAGSLRKLLACGCPSGGERLNSHKRLALPTGERYAGLQNTSQPSQSRIPGRVEEIYGGLSANQNSGYFLDDNWYRQNNPDVFEASRSAAALSGIWGFEGRAHLDQKFDSAGYFRHVCDVRRSVNPPVHYLKFAGQEGRSPYGALIEAELVEDMLAIQEVYQQRFSRLIDFRHPDEIQ